ncbi:MAG: hypothetical protein ACREGB_00490 [Candidatus Saccharimonadales bacterium]
MAAPITRELLQSPANNHRPAVLARCDEIATSLYGEATYEASRLLNAMFDLVCDHAEVPDVLLNKLEDDQIEDLMLGLGVRRAIGQNFAGLNQEQVRREIELIMPLSAEGAV